MKPYSLCRKLRLERTEGRSASVVETPQPSAHVHACSFLLLVGDVLPGKFLISNRDKRRDVLGVVDCLRVAAPAGLLL
jgi:hypothetical protein